jgi:hypothetical protein
MSQSTSKSDRQSNSKANPGPSTPRYVFAQGEKSFSAQCDVTNVDQALWLLWHGGVPPAHVRAYVCPLDPKVKWPSAHAGFPDLELPPEYENTSVVQSLDRLADHIGDDLQTFLDDDTASCVVLMYWNHGDHGGLGSGTARIAVSDIQGWMRMAESAKKPLLIILDACNSTTLAQSIWGDFAKVRSAAAMERLGRFVGFLTSADGPALTSAFVFSKDNTLVYPLLPPAEVTWTDYAPGYRLFNSMFSRQLLWFWAYGLRRGGGTTLRGLPDLLNDHATFYDENGELRNPNEDGFFCNGFHAKFVGGSAGLGDLAVESFLPLGPVAPDKMVPLGAKQAPFGQVIPEARMGKLFDDMRAFWKTKGDEEHFRYRFVEIARVDNQIKVVDSGHLNGALAQHPISRYIATHRSSAAEDANPEGEQRVTVPWRDLANLFYAEVEKDGWTRDPRVHVPIEKYNDCKAYLVRLNGAVPDASDFVHWMAHYACQQPEPETFRLLMDRLYTVLASSIRTPLAEAAGAPPEPDSPVEPEVLD